MNIQINNAKNNLKKRVSVIVVFSENGENETINPNLINELCLSENR